ncbi:phosphotransferase [Streptomyces sp. NPDC085466]|uniref:phosphotransferase n=1 Tax=Streptomyces sp. NPDC085466 TaxID=3365725 RepID=UPI0037D30EBA
MADVIDEALVRRLVAAQFPRWAGLGVRRVASAGTDNAMFRLGDDLVVRLPKAGWAAGQAEKEQRWLPRLAPALPLPVPLPLGAAVAALAAAGLLDERAALDAWDRTLTLPAWDRPPVWLHGDLLPGNLLTRDGRLSAVIDFGGLGTGDPAADLLPAWTLLTPATRPLFRAASRVDDATWARGRGWALCWGLVTDHYYGATGGPGTAPTPNPVLAAVARRAWTEALPEFR